MTSILNDVTHKWPTNSRGTSNIFAMEETSSCPFLPCSDEGIRELCPGIVVELYGTINTAVSCL